MNEPPVQIRYDATFKREAKSLRKKYPHIQDDLNSLIQSLEQGETPGDQMSGVGYTAYKVRIPNTDSNTGKSGGYRVVYYIQTPESVVLMSIYTKSDQSNITPRQVKTRIEQYLKK